MGYTFLEFIKKTGIFLICAESILHFMPGSSYQKYVKVLIGIIVLAQFLIPLKALLTGQERVAIEQQIAEFQNVIEMQSEELPEIWPDTGVETQTKKEIKSRLNNIAVENGYRIDDIVFNEIAYVIVSKEKASEIKVPKVALGQNNDRQNNEGQNNEGQNNERQNNERQNNEGQNNEGQEKEELQELKKLFCAELGTEEIYLEVVENG